MSKESDIPFESLDVPGLEQVLETVGTSCGELGIEYFIVGSLGRNIWMVEHGERSILTRDIDIAVCVPTQEAYIELKARLEKGHGFIPRPNNAFRSIAPGGSVIDLLPFGEIEQNGRVAIEGIGLADISLEGFTEIKTLGLRWVSLGGKKYAACTPAAMVILKLIAYDDRPEMRMKDVKDIRAIIDYYPRLEDTHVWHNHSDLYDDKLEHSDVSQIALGREIRKICATNHQLLDRVVSILEKALKRKSSLLQLMVTNNEIEWIEDMEEIVRRLLTGLEVIHS